MKKNLKPYVYKHTKQFNLRCGTFCRTVRRVIVCSKVKLLSNGAEGKPRVKSPLKLHVIDPKPGDLSMSRLKLP